MKLVLRLYALAHGFMALLFAGAGLVLVATAARAGWRASVGDWDNGASEAMIEAMGVLAAAVVAMQISQTIAEEEVIRDAHISAPTRVRRFLSRFMVVIVVAIAVEALVTIFKARAEPALMFNAAALVVAVGLLLAGWGVFIRMNRAAEELEPEAMAEAKEEDRKLQ